MESNVTDVTVRNEGMGAEEIGGYLPYCPGEYRAEAVIPTIHSDVGMVPLPIPQPSSVRDMAVWVLFLQYSAHGTPDSRKALVTDVGRIIDCVQAGRRVATKLGPGRPPKPSRLDARGRPGEPFPPKAGELLIWGQWLRKVAADWVEWRPLSRRGLADQEFADWMSKKEDKAVPFEVSTFWRNRYVRGLLALKPVRDWLLKCAAKPEEDVPLGTLPWVIARAMRETPPGYYDVPRGPKYAVDRLREDHSRFRKAEPLAALSLDYPGVARALMAEIWNRRLGPWAAPYWQTPEGRALLEKADASLRAGPTSPDSKLYERPPQKLLTRARDQALGLTAYPGSANPDHRLFPGEIWYARAPGGRRFFLHPAAQDEARRRLVV